MAVWLYAVAAGLTVLSLVADALVLSRGEGGPAAARLVDLVDLDAEANAPAFFSTMLLATAGNQVFVDMPLYRLSRRLK